MNFEEALSAKIAEAQAKAQLKTNASLENLLENDSFIEAQRYIAASNAEVSALDKIITQLNAIPAYQAKSGDKFNVKAFAINDFSTGLDRILGIINGARSAFVDELALNYSAITGISMLELELARTALGQPTYFSKGQIFDEVRGDVSALNEYLRSICIKLKIFELPTKVTQEAVDLWFLRSRIRAEKAQAEFEKQVVLNSSKQFTIED